MGKPSSVLFGFEPQNGSQGYLKKEVNTALENFKDIGVGALFFIPGDLDGHIWRKGPDGKFINASCAEKGKKGLHRHCSEDTPCKVLNLDDMGSMNKIAQVETKRGLMEVTVVNEEEYTGIALLYKEPGNGEPGAVMVCQNDTGDVSLAVYAKDRPEDDPIEFPMGRKE